MGKRALGVFRKRKAMYWSALLLAFFVPATAAALLGNTSADVTSDVTNVNDEDLSVEPVTETVSEVVDSTAPAQESVKGTSTNITSVNGEVSVKVNGEEVAIPQNGSTQTRTDNGTVTITSSNSSSGNSGNNYSFTTNVSTYNSSSNSNSSSFQQNNTFTSGP